MSDHHACFDAFAAATSGLDAADDRKGRPHRRRRRWTSAEKARIVAESREGHQSVSAVARRYGIHPNLLYTWRRALQCEADDQGATAPAGATAFVPVTLTSPVCATSSPASSASDGWIEVLVAGLTVRVGEQADTAVLQRVLAAVRWVA